MAGNRRLILDTGVLVDAARGRLDPTAMTADDDIVVPAMVVAEFLVGIALDRDPGRAAAQRRFLDDVLAEVPIVPYDIRVAVHHAELLAAARERGQSRGPMDLAIAATARATGRLLLTTDRGADFQALPEVESLLVGRHDRRRA